MPKTTFERIVFSIIMSMTMAYGMEVYNVAFSMGYALMPGGLSNMTNIVFIKALKEGAFMCPLVFAFSNLWGNRLGQKIAFGLVNPHKDSPLLVTIIVSACTVLVMCPTMSLSASVIFSIILGGRSVLQLPAIFIGTLIKNFPMALLWNLFAAGPITRLLFKKLFSHRREKQLKACDQNS